MARYLIDTGVMIDVSRGNAAAATFVDSLEGGHTLWASRPKKRNPPKTASGTHPFEAWRAPGETRIPDLLVRNR